MVECINGGTTIVGITHHFTWMHGGSVDLFVADSLLEEHALGCFRRPSSMSVRVAAASVSASERIRKTGHAINGAQRAKCRDCERTFILPPRGARDDEPFKAQVLAAYQDRMSFRGIQRTFGGCDKTVRRWLGEKAASLPAFNDPLLPSQTGDVLELDELWSFVGSKAQTLWLWTALCRRTRQVVADTLEDRGLQRACDLRASLPRDYQR